MRRMFIYVRCLQQHLWSVPGEDICIRWHIHLLLLQVKELFLLGKDRIQSMVSAACAHLHHSTSAGMQLRLSVIYGQLECRVKVHAYAICAESRADS